MKTTIKSEQNVVSTETTTTTETEQPELKLNVRRVRVSTSVKGGPMSGSCRGSWAN